VPQLKGRRCVDVACGARCTLTLTDGGTIYCCGGEAAAAQRLRLAGGAACAFAAGGGHCCAAMGDAPAPQTDAELALAHRVGFALPAGREAAPAAVVSGLELAGPPSALIESRAAPDAEPSVVVRELQQLRALLAQEEAHRDATSAELAALQEQLQNSLVEEELMRERRGGEGAPEADAAAALGKGLALMDKETYAGGHVAFVLARRSPVWLSAKSTDDGLGASFGRYEKMLPDERLEVNLAGLKVAMAVVQP
jgi:hypothetical protein